MRRYPECPRYLPCNDINKSSIALGGGPAIVSITSSTLSCLGSLLIVYTYLRWRDVRSGSRRVITFLAIADFFTAFGYVLGSSNYLVYFALNYNESGTEYGCPAFVNICEIQSYLTTWSSISSFVWTSALAFYFYLILVKDRLLLATRLIPWFHVVAWGFPIAICLPLLITGKLGFAPYAASTWCFIYDNQNHHKHVTDKEIGIILLAGKLWEILTYAVVIVLYTAIKCHIWKETRRDESKQFISMGLVAAVQKADRRLTLIPVIFILLRIWGTIQFFYSIVVSRSGSITSYHECVSNGVSVGFLILGYLQAIGDGGQGWGNVILYIFASEKLRKRFFGWMICVHKPKCLSHTDCPTKPIVHGFKEQYASINNHLTTMNNPRSVSAFNGKMVAHCTPEVQQPLSVMLEDNAESLLVNSHEPTTEFNT